MGDAQFQQKAREQYDSLSPDDRKILDDYHHKHSKDPNHPANPNNPHHGEFLKGLVGKFGNAAVFGAGASMGADMINKLFNH